MKGRKKNKRKTQHAQAAVPAEPHSPPEAAPKLASPSTVRPRYRASSAFTHSGGPFYSEHGFWPPKTEPTRIPLDSQKTNRPAEQKGGRPRKDDTRAKILELRAEGKSWGQVEKIMNQGLPKEEKRSKDAYRMLVTGKAARNPESANETPNKTPK